MSRFSATALAAPALAGVARAALGLLWLGEGVTKIRAGFGRADILLVVTGATGNSRVPEPFQVFAQQLLGRFPELFGTAVPLTEIALGLALLLGVLTVPAAAVSALLLNTYWIADQLIAAYPVMAVLSACVLLFARASRRFSLGSLLIRNRANGKPVTGARGLLHRLL